ncbi:hypothetical protein A2911_00330 [Candidatus Nomurabacteria bacterium RIFCSPLOWO2_01_FULL_40_15]|uniref:Uncharacterized protein n=1 Tax=Candidatus Nomurabacteria bacterium RIFCSPLOWO2_01_FULL_40_15 TaxID=1801772 RepID=A0A1F6X9T8_9BACT|nr:MAG: hypothetical protein A2911_00330 [Candidatus Nomurabacteria bacterium RIFCSPLOWO2_01_FULL_40_15]
MKFSLKITKEFGLIFWVHLFLIIFFYLSFLYIDWRIILSGIILLQIYYLLRGGCDLTFIQFGDDKNTTFVWYYLHKFLPNLNKKTTKIFIRYIIPSIIFLASFLLQEFIGYIPLIKF